nr:ABC transporter permease [Chelatococcus sp. YT9]
MILLFAPLIIVIAVSVNPGQFVIFPPQGFGLRWYGAVLSSEAFRDATIISLQLAVAVTLTATLAGASAAIAIHRRQLPGGQLFGLLFLSPLILPTIVFALGMLMAWSAVFGQASFAALWIAHSVIAIPYVLRTTLAVLSELNPHLEEAARTMGAGALQRLWLVVVPQIMPGIAAGAFFAFNISFDEAVLSLFLRTPDLTTLPIQIYNQLEYNTDPTVAAASALMILVTVALIALTDRLVGLQRFAST